MPLMGAVDGDMQPKVNKKRLPNNKLKVKKTLPHQESPTFRESTFQPVPAIIFNNNDLQDQHQKENTDTPGKHSGNVSTADHSATQSTINNNQPSKKGSGPRYSFSTEIPEKYDDFYLRVLPRDPQWMYVYWELPDGTNGSSEKAIRADSEISQWVLRVKASSSADVKNPSDGCQFDIPINLADSSSYVKLPEPGYKCTIECGHITNEGEFIPASSMVPCNVPPPVVKNKLPENAHQFDAVDKGPLHIFPWTVSADPSGDRIKDTDISGSTTEQVVRYLGSAAPK